MNRQQEYWDLMGQLSHPPAALDGTALRARDRAKRHRRGKRWGISLGSVAGVCAAFVVAVNTLPTFALACAKVPVLRELAAAVAFSPSLSAAVEHDYVQYVGQSQTFDGTTLTLDYVIADQQQMVVFYRTDGDFLSYSASCDLKDANGAPLFGYSVNSTTSSEELKQFEIHFKELEEIPQALTLDVTLWGGDVKGQEQKLDHTYTFQLTLDPSKTAPVVEIPVNRWVEVDGQRLLVDHLELTPTKTTLCLEEDPANTAWLQRLEFHFTDPDGQRYETIDSSLSATGAADHPGFYTYYFQSLYFVKDVSRLTLHLDGAVWLDKEAQPVTVDLTNNTWTGSLPEGVTGLRAEPLSSQGTDAGWTLTVRCTADRAPFELDYRDPEGGVHHTGGYSRRGDQENPGNYVYVYPLEHYPWSQAEFTLTYTSAAPLSEAVPLSPS